MSRTRAVVPVLLAALVAVACASGSGVDRDLVEAGRRIRREQPPPTAAELRLEVDSFLDNELPLLQGKVDRRLEREVKIWRAVFIGGAALGVLATTSGTLSSGDGAVQPVLTGIGAAAAVVGGVAYFARTRELRACRTFLEAARLDVVSWRRNGIPPVEGVVAPAVWHAWVDRVAGVRGNESCGAVR